MKVTLKKHKANTMHCCHKCDLYADDIYDGHIDDFCDGCESQYYEVIEREPVNFEFIVKDK